MTGKEKIYILKHTPEGFTLTPERDSDQVIAEDGISDPQCLNALTKPRWEHWNQRKLARPYQATLLGMNIEPTPKARNILKAHDKHRYEIFKDRLDILQTLMGVEVGVYVNHYREGDGVNEKYIELAEYCEYAESLSWSGMQEMRTGLRLDINPPVLKMAKRQEDNVLRFLDSVLRCAVPNYFNNKHTRSSAAVLNWLKEQHEVPTISEPTLRNWLEQIQGFEKFEVEKDET